MPVTNVLIAGVGGQGVVLSGELLALAAVEAGHDVKQGEFHGVAQRGGAVFSHVRFGERVYSPMARRGTVDYLLALEKLEALRYAHFVRPKGNIVVNDHQVEPIRISDQRAYPDGAVAFLEAKDFHVTVVNATREAVQLGNHRVANVILLGTLAGFLDIPEDTWKEVLRRRFPERVQRLNEDAFTIGRSAASAPRSSPS